MQKILISLAVFSLAHGVNADSASMLAYKVQEQGVDPYFSRILVTDEFVRLDEGQNEGNYTLLDRSKGTIYNIEHEGRSVLVMDASKHKVGSQDTLVFSETITPNAQAPKVAGVQPQNVTLMANADVCAEMVTAPGLMPKALNGMREFKQILARIQASTLAARPAGVDTACDLANNVYAAEREWGFGLPVSEVIPGRKQTLVDFSESVNIDAKLFTVPEDYRQTQLPSLLAF